MGLNHISLFEGDEDSKKHWFIYEKFQAVSSVDDEDKQMVQFAATLRRDALTRFMNLTEKQPKSNNEIKTRFPIFYKAQDVKHLVEHKLK